MGTQRTYLVPSTMRTMRVLEFLAHSKRGASVSNVSRNLALPKSSAFLLLKTLEQEGYLRRSVRSGKFYLGLRLVRLCRSALANLDLREVARPCLTNLMRQTGITVHLAVLEGNEAVIIDRISPPGSSAGADWVNRRLDVNCTGVGKALAAFLPEGQFEKLITARRFARHNDNTIVTVRGLKKELCKVREQGYALDDEEDEIGVRCVGVPILDSNQQSFAAISLAGTTELIPLDRVETLASSLKQTASEISFQLSSTHGENFGGSDSFIPPVTSLSGSSLRASPGKSLLFADDEPE
jgi:DNA-binding IclR family transcriptional regulator